MGQGGLPVLVQATSFHNTCSSDTCTFNTHAGAVVHLTETPTSPSTWPFSKWTVQSVNGGVKTNPKTSAITVKSNDDYDVTATSRMNPPDGQASLLFFGLFKSFVQGQQ